MTVSINATPVLQAGDSVITFETGVDNNLTNFVFPSVQETIFVINEGVSNLTVIASGKTSILRPNNMLRITDNTDTIQVKADFGLQPFRIIGRTSVDNGVVDGYARSQIASINQSVTANTSSLADKVKKSDLVVNVKDFGAVGDGVADDTTAFTNALAQGKNVLVPDGTYKISSTLNVNYINLYGESANVSHINYTGTGYFATVTSGEKGAGIQRLDIQSQATGQSGILIKGAVGVNLKGLYINNFDQYQIRIGDATNGAGCYWSTLEEVRIRLDPARNGLCGVLIDGQFTPGSNANILKNVVIGGNYQNSLWIKGNGNNIDGGTIELTRGNENVVSVIKIEGTGNKINNIYMEPTGTMPTTVCEFTSTSEGNEVLVYTAFSPNYNMYAALLRNGIHNSFKVRSKGGNFSIGVPNTNQNNLIPNSNFGVWRDANNPMGWVFATTRISKDTTNTRGGNASLKMSESATNSTIQCYLTDYYTSTSKGNPYPLPFLQGRDVVVGVWCKTTVVGMGNIKVSSIGTGGTSYGSEKHSGSGNWELLTAHARIPTDASRVWIELRSDIANAAKTGDVYFSEPFFVLGVEAIVPEPKTITDIGGTMYGDLAFPRDALADTNSPFLVLQGYYVWVDPAGKLRLSSTRPTDMTANGTVVGTQA